MLGNCLAIQVAEATWTGGAAAWRLAAVANACLLATTSGHSSISFRPRSRCFGSATVSSYGTGMASNCRSFSVVSGPGGVGSCPHRMLAAELGDLALPFYAARIPNRRALRGISQTKGTRGLQSMLSNIAYRNASDTMLGVHHMHQLTPRAILR